MLSSCNKDEEGGSGESGGSDGAEDSGGDNAEGAGRVDYGDATVYLDGDKVQIVLGIGGDSGSVSELNYQLSAMGVDVSVGNMYFEEEEYEIVVGKAEGRAVSDTAYRLLGRIDKGGIFDMRYLVYADSGKVAVAFDTNPYTDIQPLPYVMSELVSKYAKDKEYFATAKGILIQGTVDLIEKQAELDGEELAEIWAEVDSLTNDDIYNALRNLYSMYDDRLIGWYANLYDPGTGAYYSSSSGRDNPGYFPSVEPTFQALNFLVSSGMLNGYDGGWVEAIPDIMKYRLVYYVKSLQNPNGYFYDPNVPKDTLDTKGRTRLGRDLQWCAGILSALGEKPTYNTPTGTKGDFVTADEYWESLGLDIEPPTVPKNPADEKPVASTASFTASVATAVSKAIGTSQVVATAAGDFVSSFENLIDYLEGLNMDTDPYASGNDINASNSQIFSASKKMGTYTPEAGASEKYTKYAGLTMNEILLKYLNGKINPDTGLWGLTDAKNPLGTEFKFTNGFFKLIGTYNSLGVAYPYPVKAANALLDGMVSDQPSTSNICEVYNIWAAILSLRENVEKYNTESGDEVMQLINETLAERGAKAIKVSHQKQSGYKKPDGAYAHYVKGSLGTIQGGVATGIGGLEEGFVDAIGKATTGLAPSMTSILNLPDIPLYTQHHWMMYLEILLELDPVIKYSYFGEESGAAESEPHSMDELPESKYMSSVLNSVGSLAVTAEGEENVLLLDKFATGKQSYLTFYPNVSSAGANICELSTRLRISGSKGVLTFSFGPKNSGHDNKPTRISFISSEDGTIKLYEEEWLGTGTGAKKGSNDYVIEPKVGEWFDLTIQYYEGNGIDESTARVKVYVNEKLIFCSNDFYSKWSDAGKVDSVMILCTSGFFGKVWLDELMLKQYNDTVKDDPLTEPDTPENPDTGGGQTPETPTEPDTPAIPEPEGGFSFDSAPKLPLTSGDLKLSDNSGYLAATSANGTVTDASGNTVPQWKGSIVITGDEDKFLRINDVAPGCTYSNGSCTDEEALTCDVAQGILALSGIKSTGNTVSYSMKIRFNALEDGTRKISSHHLDFRMRDSSGSKGVQFNLSTDADGTVRCAIKTSAGNVTESAELKVEDGAWMNFRIEYTAVGDSYDANNYSVKLYVNDTLLAKTAEQSVNGFTPVASINTVQLVLDRGLVAVIDIDDIKVSYEATEDTPSSPENPDTGEGEGTENPGTGDGTDTPTNPENPDTGGGEDTETPENPDTGGDTPDIPDAPELNMPEGAVKAEGTVGETWVNGAEDSVLMGIKNVGNYNSTTSPKLLADTDGTRFVRLSNTEVGQQPTIAWVKNNDAATETSLTFEVMMRITSHVGGMSFRAYSGGDLDNPLGGTKISGSDISLSVANGTFGGVELGVDLNDWFTLRLVLEGATVKVYTGEGNGSLTYRGDVAVSTSYDLADATLIAFKGSSTTKGEYDVAYSYLGAELPEPTVSVNP